MEDTKDNTEQKLDKMKEINTKEKQIEDLDKKILDKKAELEKKNGRRVFLFLGKDISDDTVTDVFQDLRENFKDTNGRLDVIIDSGGGIFMRHLTWPHFLENMLQLS